MATAPLDLVAGMGRRVRATIRDGRVFVGDWMGTDYLNNLLLANVEECQGGGCGRGGCVPL
jgi:small nuclear ribonucleoprotein (snRNP)-like protein